MNLDLNRAGVEHEGGGLEPCVLEDIRSLTVDWVTVPSIIIRLMDDERIHIMTDHYMALFRLIGLCMDLCNEEGHIVSGGKNYIMFVDKDEFSKMMGEENKEQQTA